MVETNDPAFIKLETEIRLLSEKVNSIDTKTASLSELDRNVRDVMTKINVVETKTDNVERKTPPLATTVAAVGVIAAAVGGSFLNTWSLGDDVTQLNTKLNEASLIIQKMPEQIEETAGQLEEGLKLFEKKTQNVVTAMATFEGNLKGTETTLRSTTDRLSELLTAQVRRTEEFESRIAALILKLEKADRLSSNTSSKPVAPLTEESQPDDRRNLISLAEDAGLDVPIHFKLITTADIAMERGDYSEARQILEEAKEKDPEGDALGFYSGRIAQTYLAEGDLTVAASMFELAIENGPNVAAHWNNLGSVHFAQAMKRPDNTSERDQKLDETIRAQLKAIEIDDGDKTVQAVNISLSYVMLSSPDFEAAIRVLDDHASPNEPDTLFQYARIYAQQGDTSLFLLKAQELVTSDPSQALLFAVDPVFEPFRNNTEFREIMKSVPASDFLFE